ncbi:hypothetical protein [Nonomuraea rhizosphaerae]|uniref:hypothetical protein n=1 Tax=Nonomuraea rhizosphaerae TaxID=2665663 RepID=UPI001C5E0199|nr:hypothetical protein [Nonomuraea rhizosphaerae]
MDAYANGTHLFTFALTECLYAMVLPSNPALKMATGVTATLIGTIYSSPHDIRAAARNSHEMSRTVGDSGQIIDKAIAGISDDDWTKMGREEVDEAKKLFLRESGDGERIFGALGDSLDQLAKHSFQLAVASVAVSSVLLALSMASSAGKLFPPAAPAVEAATIPAGNAAMAALRGVVTKGSTVYLMSAGLATTVAMQLATMSSRSLTNSVNPTGKGDLPEFEQVYLPNLPTLTKDGKPLTEKKDGE